MHVTRIAAAVATCLAAGPALAATPFTFAHEWTFGHTGNALSQAQGAEILSYDAATKRLWIVGTDANVANPVGRSGIDVLNLDGSFHTSLDLQPLGGVNSVAIAFVDLETKQVTAIKAMGLKDHSLPGNGLDVSDRDGPGNNPLDGNIQNWRVQGMYMPDGIAGFTQQGQQFYVTANEGDARQDWPGFEEEVRVGSANIDPALDAALQAAHGADYKTNNDKLSRLTVSVTGDTDGDGDLDQLLAFGGRSFSILDADGNLVFDSGDRIEQIVKAFDAADALAGDLLPNLWNDSRSDNKGPEPESVVIGELAGRTLMFLGLERTSAVMVWDLTDREAPNFLDFLFTAGDVGPEGLHFFTDGGKGYLAVANEVSGTTSLYSLQPVPVPGALWLMGSAVAAVALRRRRR